MTGPFRSGLRPRRLLYLLAGAAVVMFVLATLTQGAQNDPGDARNRSFGEFSGGDTAKDCWRHHRPEGMRDTHIVVPVFPREIPQNVPVDALIQVENPWKHGISAYQIQLTLFPDASNEDRTYVHPRLGEAEDAIPPFQRRLEGELFNRRLADILWEGNVTDDVEWPEGVPAPATPTGPRPPHFANRTFTIPRTPELDYLVLNLTLVYPQGGDPPPGAPENRVTAIVYPPEHDPVPWGRETEAERTLAFPHQDVPPEAGTWNVSLEFQDGHQATVDYALTVEGVFKTDTRGRTYTVIEQPRAPSGGVPQIVIPQNSVTVPVPVTLVGVRQGTQLMEIKVSALLWWDHQAETTPNEDRYTRYHNVTVRVGERFVPSDVKLATAGVPQVHFYQQAGEITGFAAAFMLVPSLLFGGTYGRNSRKLFNALLGGAKRRVMFHNLLSLGLILVSFVHILLFLLEVRYTILMGAFYGGLAAMSLLVLGLTGYYQVPLIQRWGYGAWRLTHLAFGLLVVLFVAAHAVLDGPDFFFVEERLPQALRDLNLAQK